MSMAAIVGSLVSGQRIGERGGGEVDRARGGKAGSSPGEAGMVRGTQSTGTTAEASEALVAAAAVAALIGWQREREKPIRRRY
jgi:hypothetical protein